MESATTSDLLSILQPDADFDWIADTGAASHTTPHRHWFKSYIEKKVLIKLADNQVVYSAGIGNVQFRPKLKDGMTASTLDFQNVLHVPALRSNLLAVLYLTRHKGFKVIINSDLISFIDNSTQKVLFIASVSRRNIAHLDGVTMPYHSVCWTC